MIYFVDIDGTICNTEGNNYKDAVPIPENIAKINRLFDNGNTIVYYTSRGMTSKENHQWMTMKQLEKWGCKYNILRLDKPSFDFLIDDRALKIEEL